MTPAAPPGAAASRLRPLLPYLLPLGLACGLFFYRLDIVGLDEPSEARYAIIAADMLATGDWIVPRINGKPHVEKPPLAYWCIAASVAAFGHTDFAARLPSAVAGVGGVAVVLALGSLLFGRRVGAVAGAVLATCPQYFLHARGVTTDMILATWEAGATLAFVAGWQRPEWRGRAFWGLTLCSALAVLTKGTAGLLGIYLPIFLYAAVAREARVLRELRVVRALLYSLVPILPWLWLLERGAPGSVGYLLWRAFSSLYTAQRTHTGPVYEYVWVLGCGAFPWVVFWLPALYRALRSGLGRRAAACAPVRAGDRCGPPADGAAGPALFLALGAAGVFLFFSAMKAKLPSYLLPIYPAVAVLTARELVAAAAGGPEAAGVRRALGGAAAACALLGLVAAAVPLANVHTVGPLIECLPQAVRDDVRPELPRISIYLAPLFPALPAAVATAGVLTALFAGAWRRGTLRVALPFGLATAIALELGGLHLLARMEGTLEKGVRPFAERLRGELRPDDLLVGYNCFPRGLKYYLDRPITVVAKDGGDPELWGEIDLTGAREAGRLLDGPQRVFCVLKDSRRYAEVRQMSTRIRVIDTCGSLLLCTNR